MINRNINFQSFFLKDQLTVKISFFMLGQRIAAISLCKINLEGNDLPVW